MYFRSQFSEIGIGLCSKPHLEGSYEYLVVQKRSLFWNLRRLLLLELVHEILEIFAFYSDW